MKKVFIIGAILLFAGLCFAEPTFVNYSTKTASGLVTTGSGMYHGIKVNTDGTNAATIIVYDNTAASGTTIDPSTVYVTSATMRVQASGSNPPRRYYNGLYVSITCAGTVSATVEFTPD
ncbi:MAG: hypothetical protein ABIH23_15645 [bacterium]